MSYRDAHAATLHRIAGLRTKVEELRPRALRLDALRIEVKQLNEERQRLRSELVHFLPEGGTLRVGTTPAWGSDELHEQETVAERGRYMRWRGLHRAVRLVVLVVGAALLVAPAVLLAVRLIT